MTAVTPAGSTTCGPANHRSDEMQVRRPAHRKQRAEKVIFLVLAPGWGVACGCMLYRRVVGPSHSEGWTDEDPTTSRRSDLARFRRRLTAATHGVTTAPARITRVTAARATQARVLAEPDVVVALRLLATILDSGPTRSRECAAFGVDHAAQRAGLLPTIGQAAATVDALTAAAAILLLRPDRSCHRDACKGQKGRPQVLENSTSHHRISLEKQFHGIPALIKTGPLMSSRAKR
jgi:hypothetical protein